MPIDNALLQTGQWIEQPMKKLAKVHCVQKYENIRDTLIDLDKRYGFVIVDAAGRDSRELRTGMLAAHVSDSTVQTSQPDLDTLPKMQEIITQAIRP